MLLPESSILSAQSLSHLSFSSDLVTNPILFQDFLKCQREVRPGVRAGTLHDIKEQRRRDTICLEVYRHSDERSPIGGGPRVRGEVKTPVVGLWDISNSSATQQ
jgi:hypothetical protein